MASIPVADLKPGMRLAYDVRDGSGRLLLAAYRPLTVDVLGALHARAVMALGMHAWDDLPESARAEAPARRAWLMADASVMMELESAAAIETREGAATEEESRDAARMRSALRRSADGVIAHRSARWRRLPKRVRVDGGVWVVGAEDGDGFGGYGEMPGLWSPERLGMVRRYMSRLWDGDVIGAGVPDALVREMIDEAERRPGALVRTAVEGVREDEDAAAHAYAAACVSVEIAIRLGWDFENVRAAGLAGLLADCGLGLLPWNVRNEPRELTDVEHNAVRRHPAYSAAMLELIRAEIAEEAIPEEVQLAVYQHHEREDGSGYPNRVRGEMIHDVARVVGVADVLVGLVSARADRPALDPTGALAGVARMAHAGTLAIMPSRALAEAMVVAGGGMRVEVRMGGGAWVAA